MDPHEIERLEQGKLDILVARLFAEQDKSQLRYEALAEEPVCALVRPGHPLLGVSGLTLRDVVGAGWIVPPAGSVLRHRFELMFQEEGLAPPINVVETSALLFMTRMLQQSDMLAVIGSDVARYYAAHGIVSLVPIDMPLTDADETFTTRDFDVDERCRGGVTRPIPDQNCRQGCLSACLRTDCQRGVPVHESAQPR